MLKYPAAIALVRVDRLGEPNAPWRNLSRSREINCCRFALDSNSGSDNLATYIPVVGQRFALSTGLKGLFSCTVQSRFVNNAVQSLSHSFLTDVRVVFELSGHIYTVLLPAEIEGILGNWPW